MITPEIETTEYSARVTPQEPRMGRKGRKRKGGSRHPNGELSAKPESGPTPERCSQGIVELVESAIADDEGRPSRPHVAVDLLGTLHRRGTITAEMRQAGEDFRATFAAAQLNALKASDPGRPPIAGKSEIGARVDRARKAVWEAMLAVGGIGSPEASCIWHVIGWERPMKEWAIEQSWRGRSLSQEQAMGVLTGALDALDVYYRS